MAYPKRMSLCNVQKRNYNLKDFFIVSAEDRYIVVWHSFSLRLSWNSRQDFYRDSLCTLSLGCTYSSLFNEYRTVSQKKKKIEYKDSKIGFFLYQYTKDKVNHTTNPTSIFFCLRSITSFRMFYVNFFAAVFVFTFMCHGSRHASGTRDVPFQLTTKFHIAQIIHSFLTKTMKLCFR